MRHLLTPLILFLAATPVLAQSGRCCGGGTAKPWSGYNKVVKWENTLADAQERARKDGKLILFFQLVGDLDLEGC